jgi:hypothetical protein
MLPSMQYVSVTLRLPPKAHAEIARAAKAKGRPVTAEIMDRLGLAPLVNKGRFQEGPQTERRRGNRFKQGIPPPIKTESGRRSPA